MMWNGEERRKEIRIGMEDIKKQLMTIEIAIAGLNATVQNYHQNLKTYKESMEEELAKHRTTLYGNGQPGLTTKINDISDLKKDVDWLKMQTWIVTGGLAVGWVVVKFVLKI